MGDELVLEIRESLDTLAFANGVTPDKLHPFIDALVNRMRAHGLEDDEIRRLLEEPKN